MKLIQYSLCAAALAVANPAIAKWTTMPATLSVAVAKGQMTVVAGPGWNQDSARPFKKGETWSFDGPLLNTIDFYAAIDSGEALAKDRNKKREPLPKFAADMLPTDVAQLYEQTARITLGTSEFTVDAIEPVTFFEPTRFQIHLSLHATGRRTYQERGGSGSHSKKQALYDRLYGSSSALFQRRTPERSCSDGKRNA
ncbi:hypothetical protein D3Y57_19885 [Sphingomonas paeninsulae]|uniref:Uncharacterized protein n=1 Tax=Sphingomonas paeninsulae TaxID=2319844 RepID=A0A494TK34_SPHPE|nr:hypothetical protein [Sphingomonas paeninsulae]AYJ87772.1 hypothetical protein D3Y57_19885 [Sphingomonas paeninsulae]